MTARLIIAAPQSGSGKTLIASGLGLTLRQKGLRVQMFKVGPDYIDPSYHRLSTSRPGRNLDTWMIPGEAVCDSFRRNSQDVDIALIEGVMGLFDGFDSGGDAGSTAELAQLLQAPVVLILPVRGQARSAAAIVLGFHTFSPHLSLSGVILNQAGSARHAALCQAAIEQETAVPVLGYLPRREDFVLTERHLGLVPTNEAGEWTAVLECVAAQLRESADLDQLIAIAQSAVPLEPLPAQPAAKSKPVVRLAVAVDAAFSFTYPENLELLAEAGAAVVPFSPLEDEQLPVNIDGLILSGGFPELYAAQLSENIGMRTAVQEAAQAGLPIYAECGGFMYLTQAIVDHEGCRWPLVGVLPGDSLMTQKVTLGYRLVESTADGPLLAAGQQVRGHEFHYSQWQPPDGPFPPAYRLLDPHGNGRQARPTGIRHGSIWASYIHLHFLSQPGMAARFVAWCRERGNS